jgi:hypothetical protein
LATHEAGQEALAPVREMLTALHGWQGAERELSARMARHQGFEAVAALLLEHLEPALAANALERVRTRARRRVQGVAAQQDVLGHLDDQLVQKLKGRTSDAGRLEAALEALPPRPRSTWDYVVQNAVKAHHRAQAKDIPDELRESEPYRQPDRETPSPDLGPRWHDLLREIEADPKSTIALEAARSGYGRQETVARKHHVTTRTIRNYLAQLRAAAEEHLR